MGKKQPMQQIDDLDSSTRICPCGGSYSWSGSDDYLSKWMSEHEPHSNGKLAQEAGDDWAKVYGEKPELSITDL